MGTAGIRVTVGVLEGCQAWVGVMASTECTFHPKCLLGCWPRLLPLILQVLTLLVVREQIVR